MNERRNMRTSSITIETAPGADVFAQNVPVHCVRNGLPLISNRLRSSGPRAYLRRLRAAEMAAWELTGGDYLLPHWAARIGSR